MQCPNCNHEAPAANFGDPLCCPECGAYYEKALLAKERKAGMATAAKPAKPAKPERQVKATLGELGRRVDKGLRVVADVVTPKATVANMHGHFGKLYCPACGQVSNGVRHVPGSIFIELLLWLCFLVPGLIYSIWRHTAATRACRTCRSTGLIPVDSPRARRELGIQ